MRPDQYISWIGDFDDFDSMDDFFRGFMVDQRQNGSQKAVPNVESKKAEYSTVQAGTNGIFSSTGPIRAGDEAVAGIGGV